MKTRTFLASCLLLASCHATHENEILKGMVMDATMNTVTIITAGNDTLSFSTMNSDKTALKGLLVGDSIEVCFAGKYVPGMEAKSLATVSKAPTDDYARFFNEGIRTEAVKENADAIYIRFTEDSLEAELFMPGSCTKEVLERRTLPSGKHVWNVEDDDTKNVRYMDNCWTVSQRGKLISKQCQSDNNPQLGAWQNLRYEGILPAADCPGIKYQLHIRHREHSGDGHFLLRMTYLEAEDGKDAVYNHMGRRYTQRGIPTNPDAVVWQLVTDNGKDTYNFLYDAQKQTLTLLDRQLKPINTGLNYTLKGVD